MSNFEMMQKRLDWRGGNQEQRMIKDKYRTFLRTLKYSYQACDVQKLGEEDVWRALINPNKNSTEYDDKILSIDYKSGFEPGDIFTWNGTDTYWLVYLRELTEDAYFRSKIRRCRYELYWIDMDQEPQNRKISTYAYIRGPVETKIDSSQKTNIVIDSPNWSLEILIPKNEATLKHFKRYQTFSFQGLVWQVQVVDDISIEGVLEIIALEYYENSVLDDPDEEKVTDAFYIAPVVPTINSQNILIGDGFIKPVGKYNYTLGEDIESGGKWQIEPSNAPVILTKVNDKEISLQWTSMKSGQFTLCYNVNKNLYKRVIVVESLF